MKNTNIIMTEKIIISTMMMMMNGTTSMINHESINKI